MHVKTTASKITCIYCHATSTNRFPREHVIPEAFGKFENNLTLGCVCGECNNYFGKTLELFLARDSGEALLRLRYGLKAISEVTDLKNIRLTLTVDVPGPWHGARILLRADPTGEKLDSELLPQVAFCKKQDNNWIWLTEDQLGDPSFVSPYRANKGINIKIVGPSDEALERLKGKLEKAGIPFKQKGVLEQPITDNGSIQALVEYQIDQVIFRGIAKISFNYLAFHQEPNFVLERDFDHIRKYIRYNTLPSQPPVIASNRPILADDSTSWRQTNNHLVVLKWNKTNQKIVSQVSLFNSITYHVSLCQAYSGIWRPLQIGHHFDIDSHKIDKLTATNLIQVRL